MKKMKKQTKSIVVLAIMLVLTLFFGIVGVTGMPLTADGLYKLLPWIPTTNADAWPESISLGLDLRGGVYVEYSAEAPEGNDADFSSLLDATVSAIQSRLTDKGYAESTVQVLGTNGIRVEIPDVDDPSEILNLIGEPALLEFKDPDGNTFMTGSDVRLAQATYYDGEWGVSFQLTSEGTELFAEMTSSHIGETLSIYLDGEELMSPTVQSAITGGSGQITGNFTMDRAQTIAALYAAGSIDKKSAGRLLAFCNNCGPAFIFGVVGTTVFASPFAGFLLYAIQVFSALLCGVLRRGAGSETALASAEKSASAEPPAFSAAFTASVKKAGQTVLEVCMFVTVFGVLSAMAQNALSGLLPAWAAFLPAGLLELSGGADALARAPLSQGVKFIGASFFLAFGGLSVHAQTKAVLHTTGLDALPVFVPKLLHALAAALLSVPVYLLFQNRLDAAPAFAWSAPAGIFWLSGPVFAASVFLLFRKMAGSNLQQDRV